jgi:dTDP-4-amino-4,6-dideoxygalactose transaminase
VSSTISRDLEEAKDKMSEAKADAFCHFHRPWLGEEEEREIIETLRSGWLTTGARTHDFERQFAEYVGCKHAIGLNSCTAGLHLALSALDIGPGDEVITSPITFAATANVIVHQGAKPVFVDVEPDTLQIDAQQIENRINAKTKAILPVHLYGHPCDMDAIQTLSQKYCLAVIEDAAHAVESKFHGKKIGNIGDATSFSFYATKNMTTGEGGMLTTNRDDLAETIRVLSLHGITADAWMRHGEGEYVHYDVLYPGYKYNMFDIQAALGLHQLKKLDFFWERRNHYVQMYDVAFRDMPEIKLLTARENVKHAHHLYPILINTNGAGLDRDSILAALGNAGIGAGVHFRALHLMSFYQKQFGFRRGDLPNAEYASDRLLSLPLYPRMVEADIQRVVATLKQILYSRKNQSAVTR